jgi:homoserine O-acetyltransferase
MYGAPPRADGSNVAFVAHALTGSSRVAEWWSEIVGPGKLLDPGTFAVAGINALGSCYGSTGPTSIGPNGKPWGADFPIVTVGDIVRAEVRALAAVGIERIAVAIGGSLGGMQVVELALQVPDRVERAMVVGAYDYFAAMGIALNAVAREAIRIARDPLEGLELARKIAMLTYKSETLLATRFGRRFDRNGGNPTREKNGRFDVEGYLDYQGAIFSKRMNVDAYLTLTRAMDLFDTRDRSLANAPNPALTFVGITSDWLFMPQYVRAAAERFAREGASSEYVEFASDHGHDAFLAEPQHLRELLVPRLADAYARLAANVR